MAIAQAVFTRRSGEVVREQRVEYFINSKRVTDFNKSNIETGNDVSIEIIANRWNYEFLGSIDLSARINGNKYSIKDIAPFKGLGMKATILLGAYHNG